MNEMEWKSFVSNWMDCCSKDEVLKTINEGDFSFCIGYGALRTLFVLKNGEIEDWVFAPTIHYTWDFSLNSTPEVWDKYLQESPPPLYHDLFSMSSKVPDFYIDGKRETFMKYAHIVRKIMELGRETLNGTNTQKEPELPPSLGIEPITGHYVNVEIDGQVYRIYYEESGKGDDLLFLHTAGSDSRQNYHLMNNSKLLKDWHMVTFDMPLHGKSLPPSNFIPGTYRLTTDFYTKVIVKVVEALGLNQPVVVGSSMAGEICLELAYRFPDLFKGVVACEACDYIEGRHVGWTKDPNINESIFVPEWIHGLMSPFTADKHKQEIMWEYSQGGHGVFYGDIAFYSGDWDAREYIHNIDTSRCPVYMLTGEYDFSCTPEMSEKTAKKIKGAKFTEMKGIGHFPMVEDPDLYLSYLLPVLQEIKIMEKKSGEQILK